MNEQRRIKRPTRKQAIIGGAVVGGTAGAITIGVLARRADRRHGTFGGHIAANGAAERAAKSEAKAVEARAIASVTGSPQAVKDAEKAEAKAKAKAERYARQLAADNEARAKARSARDELAQRIEEKLTAEDARASSAADLQAYVRNGDQRPEVASSEAALRERVQQLEEALAQASAQPSNADLEALIAKAVAEATAAPASSRLSYENIQDLADKARAGDTASLTTLRGFVSALMPELEEPAGWVGWLAFPGASPVRKDTSAEFVALDEDGRVAAARFDEVKNVIDRAMVLGWLHDQVEINA